MSNFPSVPEDLTYAHNSVVKNPEECPDWFTQDTTYLLPQNRKDVGEEATDAKTSSSSTRPPWKR